MTTLRDRLAVLRWAMSGQADADRHTDLARRFPDAYVVRAQAVPDVRASLARFAPAYLPPRDTMFDLVVDARGFGFWAGGTSPFRFLLLPWPAVGAFTLRSYVDFPIRDLLAVDGGHVTTLAVVPVGDRVLELALWGDEQHDQTEHLLDEYGLRTALARIERFRAARYASKAPDAAASRSRKPPLALPPVAITREGHPWFRRWRRRR